MISKRAAAAGAVVIILVVSFFSAFATLQVSDYLDTRNGDKITITKEQFQQLQSTGKLDEIKAIVQQDYIEKVDKENLLDGAVKGLVASLDDPYSVYFTPKEFREFQEHTQGSYAGVGLLVTVDPNDKLITVVQSFKNSPSAKAGILPGDKIVKVNDTDVDGTMLDKAVMLMKGPKGTEVTVTIYRDGQSNDYKLKRDIITIETVEGKMLADNIGYMKITTFDEKTDKDFSNTLSTLQKKKMKALIIDLRDNPGGLLNVVSKIADQLLPEGKIVYTEDRYGKQETEMSDARALNLPMVLLVNGNSASASEILAGAVQDYNAGKLVGTKTFGKGIVQSIRVFKDGSGLKLTTSRYFTPKGRSIHKVGIKPDVEIDLPEELKKNPLNLKEENDVQLKKGIGVIKELIK